jgi:hypothetical protein
MGGKILSEQRMKSALKVTELRDYESTGGESRQVFPILALPTW